jgi:hypothetical protein
MYGLARWTIGDPLTSAMEAIDAVDACEGQAVDRILADLNAEELALLAINADTLAEHCRAALRARS